MNKVLLSVAPVSASSTHIDPAAIAADVLDCYKAGAGMVHLHVRDAHGQLTPDLTVFKETVERIHDLCDIVIEASTGGVSNLTIAERCAPLGYDRVECASLNVGSVNLGANVYANPIGDVRYCVEQILKAGKTPEVEIFEIGMIDATLQLYKEMPFKDPLLFSIVLGHVGAAPATIPALTALRSFIPDNMLWGITHAHRENNDIFSAAIGMGACTVRVGFEDSDYIQLGKRSDTNAPIVAHIARLVEAMGKEPMRPDDAREIFGIGQ